MANRVVLDTSAFLALTGREPGAEEVEETISEAMDGRTDLHASFVSLTEVEYITIQEEGQTIADQRLADIQSLPIRWHHSDESLRREAAKLQAMHKLSFADSFVAATAKRLDAVLMHKDPQFTAVGSHVKQKMLPPKSGPRTRGN